jgi:hypothetical protein
VEREEGPERVTVAIREIARIPELLDGRQRVVERRVAQPHLGIRVHRAERQELGHPLDEPPGQRERVTLDAFRDVDLERVRDLVPEHVVGLAEAGDEGHRNARLRPLGEAADAFARRPRREVGLREMGMARVENDRLPLVEAVIEQRGEARVPPLRHARCVPRRRFLLGVVIDVEVLGPEHTEVEAVVLDLVASEVLRIRRRGCEQHRRERQTDHRPWHGHPWDDWKVRLP